MPAAAAPATITNKIRRNFVILEVRRILAAILPMIALSKFRDGDRWQFAGQFDNSHVVTATIKVATKEGKDRNEICELLPKDLVTYSFPMEVKTDFGTHWIVGEIEFANQDGVLINTGPMVARQITFDEFIRSTTPPSGKREDRPARYARIKLD